MGGSASIQTGFNYFGSFGMLIGLGPMDVLEEIDNGDTPIWIGPIYRSEAMDADGKTTLTTTIGTIRFYWGSSSQNPDPLLQTLYIDQGNGPATVPMPSFQRLCYCVAVDVAFGTQTAPPTLKFIVRRYPEQLAIDMGVTNIDVTDGGSGYSVPPTVNIAGDGIGATAVARVFSGKVFLVDITNSGSGYTAATVSFTPVSGGSGATAKAYLLHEIQGDAVMAEALYDLWTDTFYGAGIDPSNFILQDFLDAATTLVAEGFGVSPVVDALQSLREISGKLFPYVDSFPYLKEGKIGYKLIRTVDPFAVPTLDENDFTEELRPENSGMEATWNFTRVNFTDRDNKWTQAIEGYDNPANAAIVGMRVEKQLDYPFITRRDVAKLAAKRAAIKAGTPPIFFTAKVLPKHADKHPGDVVVVNYAKLGINALAVRITGRKVGGPGSPEIEMTFMIEQTRDTTHDYVPPEDFLTTPALVDQAGGSNYNVISDVGDPPRVATLPDALKGSEPDGFLSAFGRLSATESAFKIWYTYDETLQDYIQMDHERTAPIHATLVAWQQISATNWIFRIKPLQTFDYSAFMEVAMGSANYYFVTGERTVRLSGTPSDSHLVPSLWGQRAASGYLVAVGADMFDIEVKVAAFGTDPLSLETVASPATSPTQHIYFASKDNFAIVPTSEINFQRPGPNAPVDPATGLSPDTALKRRVKVTRTTFKQSNTLADVLEAYYDRDDTTMSPDGTYSPDWGRRAPTFYEAVDLASGAQVLAPGGHDYLTIADIDLILGAFFLGTATSTQKRIWTTIDDTLGTYLLNQNNIYNSLP